MPIGTSDGEVYNSRLDYLIQTAPRRGLEGSTEPADALKSPEGTKPTPEDKTSVRPSKRPVYPVQAPGDFSLPSEPAGEVNFPSLIDTIKGIPESAKNFLMTPGDAYAGRFDPSSEEGIRRSLDMAGWMVGAPAPVASKLADGTLGSFAGVKSIKNLPAKEQGELYNRIGHAKVLEANGVSKDEIWQTTGIGKFTDNMIRREIDDSKSVVNESWIDRQPNSQGDRVAKLTEVLDHPELIKNYPDMKDMNVVLDSSLKPSAAHYDPKTDSIHVGSDAALNKSTILHEIQHAIQEREGFAKGGSWVDYRKGDSPYKLNMTPFVEKLRPEFQTLTESLMQKHHNKQPITAKEVNRFRELKTIFEKNQDYLIEGTKASADNYMRLAGEVEARNVEARLYMSEKERQMIPPRFTEEERYQNRQVVVTEPAWATAYGVVDPVTGKRIKQ